MQVITANGASRIGVRNNVQLLGRGDKILVLAHGFGCDQNMWRFLLPGLLDRYRVVLFDYVGSGQSDPHAFTVERYSTLEGYAQDLNEIYGAFDLQEISFVGHSVSATIGMIAAANDPGRFSDLALICPSPCFINDPPDYHGGFEREDIADLLDLLDKNYIGWASHLAPIVMGLKTGDPLVAELSGSMCSTDPLIARTFAKATFLSDYRHLLPRVEHPALMLQSATDALAPPEVGEYMHAHMPSSRLRVIDAEGHCLHMTHPDAVLRELRAFVRS